MCNGLPCAVVATMLAVFGPFVAAEVARAEVETSPDAHDGADRQSQPNVLFLLTDDQRDNAFGEMGHPLVKTPNVDHLLRQSVRFSNTCIAEPTCSPSRPACLEHHVRYYLPLTAPHTPLAVTEEWRGKSGLNTYADFVTETDAVIERVLKAIDDAGGWNPREDGHPAQLYNLSDDLPEKQNLYDDQPAIVRQLNDLMRRLIHDERSGPGPPQPNDVPVLWKPLQ
jgi:hypothetical protein